MESELNEFSLFEKHEKNKPQFKFTGGLRGPNAACSSTSLGRFALHTGRLWLQREDFRHLPLWPPFVSAPPSQWRL